MLDALHDYDSASSLGGSDAPQAPPRTTGVLWGWQCCPLPLTFPSSSSSAHTSQPSLYLYAQIQGGASSLPGKFGVMQTALSTHKFPQSPSKGWYSLCQHQYPPHPHWGAPEEPRSHGWDCVHLIFFLLEFLFRFFSSLDDENLGFRRDGVVDISPLPQQLGFIWGETLQWKSDSALPCWSPKSIIKLFCNVRQICSSW